VNDVIVTMKMKDLDLGDIIEVNQIREIGSKDYILQGNPFVHPNYISIKCVVIEHPVGPLTTHTWHRRRGHSKTRKHQNHYTALRVSEISIKSI